MPNASERGPGGRSVTDSVQLGVVRTADAFGWADSPSHEPSLAFAGEFFSQVMATSLGLPLLGGLVLGVALALASFSGVILQFKKNHNNQLFFVRRNVS